MPQGNCHGFYPTSDLIATKLKRVLPREAERAPYIKDKGKEKLGETETGSKLYMWVVKGTEASQLQTEILRKSMT